jgi:hypothetical protein
MEFIRCFLRWHLAVPGVCSYVRNGTPSSRLRGGVTYGSGSTVLHLTQWGFYDTDQGAGRSYYPAPVWYHVCVCLLLRRNMNLYTALASPWRHIRRVTGSRVFDERGRMMTTTKRCKGRCCTMPRYITNEIYYFPELRSESELITRVKNHESRSIQK